MVKKFEVHDSENLETRKTFRIESDRKAFIVESEPFPVVQSEWFRQTNAYDCGPGLLLNALHALNIENIPRTIGELREEINTLRAIRREHGLHENEWFTTKDINEYLRTKGFVPRTYGSNDPESIGDLTSDIRQRPFDFSYTSYPGSHYRGFVSGNRSGEILLLDSLSNGPQLISQEEFDAIMRETLDAPSENGRYENFVVVRKMRG